MVGSGAGSWLGRERRPLSAGEETGRTLRSTAGGVAVLGLFLQGIEGWRPWRIDVVRRSSLRRCP